MNVSKYIKKWTEVQKNQKLVNQLRNEFVSKENNTNLSKKNKLNYQVSFYY